jgi:hypothetical protein
MVIRFCRDCANFEDRRDIDGTVLCAKNQGPYVCCDEFEPKHKSINANRVYNRFCIECANFEDVEGNSLCAKNHTPKIACDGFESRFEKLNVKQQNNRIKTALVAYAATHYNPKPIPVSLIKIGQKIKW